MRTASGQPISFSYRLVQWKRDSGFVRVLEHETDWWNERSSPQALLGSRTSTPAPHLIGLQHGEDGRLWVYARVASPDWKRRWAPAQSTGYEVVSASIDRHLMFRTVIELIDPETAAVVAQRFLDEYAVDRLPGDRVAIYSEDSDGLPLIAIAAVRLTMTER